jgi:hypothetical protein
MRTKTHYLRKLEILADVASRSRRAAAKTELLTACGFAVVTAFAKRLPIVRIPKQIGIAAMGSHVIDNRSGCQSIRLLAFPAKLVCGEKEHSCFFPGRVVAAARCVQSVAISAARGRLAGWLEAFGGGGHELLTCANLNPATAAQDAGNFVECRFWNRPTRADVVAMLVGQCAVVKGVAENARASQLEPLGSLSKCK